MKISLWVPFDEKQLRRTLKFILRPQARLVRILSGVVVFLGLALVAMNPSGWKGYFFTAVGLFLLVFTGPFLVARSVRMQANVIRQGLNMTLDNEAVTVTYPTVESRFSWAALGRVVETPEVWYVMFGRVQAITIPKDAMTEPQRAEFAAFVRTLQNAR